MITALVARPNLDISIPLATLASSTTRLRVIDDQEDIGYDHDLDLAASQFDRHHSISPRKLTPLSFEEQHVRRSIESPYTSTYADRGALSLITPSLAATASPCCPPYFHSRYKPISESIQEEELMTDIATVTAPNSPPQLSYASKSSSSSLRSSSIDDRDESDGTQSPHFEELSLDELASPDSHIVRDSNLKPESRPTLRRPPSKAMQSRQIPNRRLSPSGGILQDQSSNLPTGRMMRAALMSRSTPNINTYFNQRRPSDAYQITSVPPSPQSIGSSTPRASQDDRTFPPYARRASAQSVRKTVKELEAEFDDGDEEVPEEAILENVPISPMPGMRHADSRTPSPRRPPMSPSYSNLHSAKVPKNARRPSAPPARSPHSRRPPTLQHSNTIGAFPPEAQYYGPVHRSKSWNDDLSNEARHLSAALEEYAVRSSPPSKPSSPRDLSRRPSVASVLELPPVQKCNIMIDPLPVSKEKEAVLTRTRPSWLPPKSQKEEKKHLKEWQAMMARAAAAEKKRTEKEREAVTKREDIQLGIESVWEHDILANWETAKDEPRTKALCWNGIAPISRGAVWMRAIGNELSLTSNSFRAALNRARTLEERLGSLPAQELSASKEAAWFSAIERDVPAAFPDLNKFTAPGSPANQALTDVLKAYAMYRSDVGYVYGTHLIAGLLCLSLRPADAFVTLANMLNRPVPLAFLVHDQSAMAAAYAQVLDALKRKHERLHAHLTSLDLMPEEYLDPLFRCLFAYNLSVPEISRLWDIYAFEGDQALVYGAVAVLGLMESKLYGSKKEVVEFIGWRNQKCWALGEEALVAAMQEART